MRLVEVTLLATVACLLSACGSDDATPAQGPTGGGAGAGGTSAEGGTSGTGGSAGAGGTQSSGGAGGSNAGGSGVDSGLGGSGGAGACAAISTIEDGLTPTQELHVATSGNDGTGNGSEATPYATIHRATQGAVPGTAIRVHAGTYAGDIYLSELTGNASAPIWVGGVAGESRPVIEGGATGLQLSRARYVIVHDLEVRNASDNGVNCDDGGDYGNPDATRYVVFRNLYIHDVGSGGNSDCLKLSGLDDYWVLDSVIERCSEGGTSSSGIDHVGCHAGVIARNEFSRMGGNAIQCKGGSRDIDIRWNHFTDCGDRTINMGGSTGEQYFRPPLSSATGNAEARDIRVLANVIEGSTAALAFVGCVDCLAANNTIIDPTYWILRILQETTTLGAYSFEPAGNGRFVNNLVVFDRSALSTYVNIGADTAPDTFEFRTNLWYAHDDPSQSQANLPGTVVGDLIGEDPLLDPGTFDIPAASPAAGAGTAVSEVSGDLHGKCYENPPSIGAVEP